MDGEASQLITSDRSQLDRLEDSVLSRCGNTDMRVDFVPSGPGTRSNCQWVPCWRIEACGPVELIVEVMVVG